MIENYPLAETTAILYSLEDIPPLTLRPFLTKDGQELWDNCRCEHDILYQKLETFFNGLPSQLDELEPDWQNYFNTRRRWFLTLYELVRQSWKYSGSQLGAI
ncbi:hypothetical protein HW132_30840 [Brasilonema sp. CT11]|nr:hypothetical protein [Brasilonema sp. CT11]